VGRAVCNFLRWEEQAEKAPMAARCLAALTDAQPCGWLRGPLLCWLEHEGTGRGKPSQTNGSRRRPRGACNDAYRHAGSMRDRLRGTIEETAATPRNR
jgi:hypothetical protein